MSGTKNNTPIYCEICKEGPLMCRDFKVHLLKKHCDRFADPNSCEWCFGCFYWSLGLSKSIISKPVIDIIGESISLKIS